MLLLPVWPSDAERLDTPAGEALHVGEELPLEWGTCCLERNASEETSATFDVPGSQRSDHGLFHPEQVRSGQCGGRRRGRRPPVPVLSLLSALAPQWHPALEQGSSWLTSTHLPQLLILAAPLRGVFVSVPLPLALRPVATRVEQSQP